MLARLRRLIGLSVALVWQAGRRELVTVAVLDLVAGLALAAQLLVVRDLVDGITDDDLSGVGDVGPALIAFAVLTVVVAGVSAFTLARRTVLAELATRETVDRILDVTTEVDLATFDDPEFHNHLTRSLEASAHRPWQVVEGLLTIIASSAAIVAMVVALVILQPILAGFALLAYIPMWLASRRNSRESYRFAHDLTAPDRERSYLQDLLSERDSAAELRVFDLAGVLRGRFDHLYDDYIAKLRALSRDRVRRTLWAAVGATVISMAVLLVIVALTADGRLTVGDAAAAGLAVLQLSIRLRSLNRGAGSLYECSLFLEDLAGFLDRPDQPATGPAEGDGPPGPTATGLAARLEDVSFTYPGADRPALREVDLSIRAGEVVAVVGENGSGKTTLARLLCGLYRPDRGSVRWEGPGTEGVDPAGLTPPERHDRVAAVFQDFVRYALPAEQNIGSGDHRRLHDRPGIVAAADEAGIADTLAALPHGFGTRLSREYEDGTELSEGQWQRVAIARALFADTPLLVLDEPTASLDPRAEHDLYLRVRHLLAGRSVLLISHRLWTVAEADRIYLLDEGRVAEHGTHDELLARGDRYAELWTLQAAPYGGVPPTGAGRA